MATDNWAAQTTADELATTDGIRMDGRPAKATIG